MDVVPEPNLIRRFLEVAPEVVVRVYDLEVRSVLLCEKSHYELVSERGTPGHETATVDDDCHVSHVLEPAHDLVCGFAAPHEARQLNPRHGALSTSRVRRYV